MDTHHRGGRGTCRDQRIQKHPFCLPPVPPSQAKLQKKITCSWQGKEGDGVEQISIKQYMFATHPLGTVPVTSGQVPHLGKGMLEAAAHVPPRPNSRPLMQL